MMSISERAGKYAKEKMDEALTNAVAQAYMDGFHDGYKTREEEIPIDLRDNKTEYVDLGLPSGTLWSDNYECDTEEEGYDVIYAPYHIAAMQSIPTEEQWNELREICVWKYINNQYGTFVEASCVGPNGNVLTFRTTGKKDIEEKTDYLHAFFWLKDDKGGNYKNAVHVFNGSTSRIICMENKVEDVFSGFKLPIRLVRQL